MDPERCCRCCNEYFSLENFQKCSKYDPFNVRSQYCKECRRSSAVYFIANRNQIDQSNWSHRLTVKIGHASDPLSRISNLQVGNCDSLAFVEIIYVQDQCNTRAKATLIEQKIHEFLRHENRGKQGEWFFISREEIQFVLRGLNYH